MLKKIIAAVLCTVSVSLATAQQMGNTKIEIGQDAPELILESPEGDTLRLSEINKGRIVLLDFWASWCRPCRNANPRLVAFYKEYKDKKFVDAKKGFTIVSVSLDTKKEAWKNAIAADSLTWQYHMSDLGGWRSAAAEIYGVSFIPQAFLLGPDGKVIGKYMFAEEAIKDMAQFPEKTSRKNKHSKK
jgi:thiol-disulfide isomerase/thioredoxin